jgi:hypothetical protein
VTTRIKKAVPYLALIAVLVGFVNFIWFFAESAAFGGDGLNGYARDGHYFLGSHGSYTEVSQALWTWSRIHGVSVFITHPLAIAGMAFLLTRFIFPSMMVGRTTQAGTDDRAARIRSSGPLITSSRTAGQVGAIRFSGPLLNVSVYPGGLVIKPVFMNAHAIPASEIQSVEPRRGVFGRRVEISHAGVDSASPFVLFGSGDSALVKAIEHVANNARAAREDAPESQGRPSTGEVFASEPQAERAPAGIMATLSILGVGVSVVMIGIGILWAIPNLGTGGLVWTAFAVFIAVSNLRRYLASR